MMSSAEEHRDNVRAWLARQPVSRASEAAQSITGSKLHQAEDAATKALMVIESKAKRYKTSAELQSELLRRLELEASGLEKVSRIAETKILSRAYEGDHHTGFAPSVRESYCRVLTSMHRARHAMEGLMTLVLNAEDLQRQGGNLLVSLVEFINQPLVESTVEWTDEPNGALDRIIERVEDTGR